MKGRKRRDGRDAVRRALDDAAAGTEPDVSRLVAAVPSILAEASRRRQAQADPLVALLGLARWAVPAMAAAAAGLVVAALVAGGGSETATGAAVSGVDRLLLTGAVGEEGDDILLEALAGGGDDRA